MVSEAGHYRLFMDLAKLYQNDSYVKKMGRFSPIEKDLMSKLELRGDRCIKQKKGRFKTSLFL